jgi:catalase-peroxidase
MRISLADLIVLGGCAAVEEAARRGGHPVRVPFRPGRTDASQEQTDIDSFKVMEPIADGFRNYVRAGVDVPAERLLVDRAQLLTLTAPEMTVLVGGLRALGVSHGEAGHGVPIATPGLLTNAFFVDLLDMGVEWRRVSGDGIYEAVDRTSGRRRWSATRADLVFGSNSELRAVAEVYASDDAGEKFVNDFVAAWTRVMELDRFDLA